MAMMMGGKGGGKGMGGKGGNNEAWKATMDKINKVEPEKKVFIEGLPEKTTWKTLSKLFEDAGYKPVLCEVMGNGKGVCTYDDEEKAISAIAALDQAPIGEKKISVDAWTVKEKTPKDEKKEEIKKKKTK